MIWIDTIVQGILLGGLYALFAAGLSLVFGIMRLVNLAHGDMIIFAAFAILLITGSLGLNPFLAALIAAPLMFALGWALQRFVLNRVLGKDILPPLLVTFGLSVALQNGMLRPSQPTASASPQGRWKAPRSIWGSSPWAGCPF
jgi:branched-chain amino acid transport system permease protein